jgi:predicted DNA-binding transcriptional regulator YafY
MRADRLVATLLLLQRRGKVTASEVARELEISERTARRDLDALGMAGLPIYSTVGRHGGWQLAGGGRTDLSGLNAAEARALFLVAGPSSSATPEVRAALRKLVRALPEPFRAHAEAAATAIVVDQSGWDRAPDRRPPPRWLEDVQRCVIEGEQIELDYTARDHSLTTRTVHPLGLAAKGAVWYLIGDTEAGLRTFRIDRMTDVRPNGKTVVRPTEFDLEQAWQLITTEVEQRRNPAHARALVDPSTVSVCRWVFGERARIGPRGAGGRIEVEFRGSHSRALAGEIAGFGASIEVIEGDEVRDHLAAIAAELHALYADDAPAADGSHGTGASWAPV